jgi:hypothetical protein
MSRCAPLFKARRASISGDPRPDQYSAHAASLAPTTRLRPSIIMSARGWIPGTSTRRHEERRELRGP